MINDFLIIIYCQIPWSAWCTWEATTQWRCTKGYTDILENSLSFVSRLLAKDHNLLFAYSIIVFLDLVIIYFYQFDISLNSDVY